MKFTLSTVAHWRNDARGKRRLETRCHGKARRGQSLRALVRYDDDNDGTQLLGMRGDQLVRWRITSHEEEMFENQHDTMSGLEKVTAITSVGQYGLCGVESDGTVRLWRPPALQGRDEAEENNNYEREAKEITWATAAAELHRCTLPTGVGKTSAECVCSWSNGEGGDVRIAVGGREVDILSLDAATGSVVWRAKNISNNNVDLRQKVWNTACCYLPSGEGNLIAAATRYGQMRLYDVRVKRRPVQAVCFERQGDTALPLTCLCTHPLDDTALFTADTAGNMRAMDSRKLIGAGGMHWSGTICPSS